MSRRYVTTHPPSRIDFSQWTLIYDHGDRKVWKLKDELIIKRVRWFINSEAVTHKFITENTTVPAPPVYSEWLSPDHYYHYLLEGCIEGVTLADCWSQLTSKERISIARQVATYMAKLGRFKGAAMQSISGEPLPNNNFIPNNPRSYLGRWRTDEEIFANEFYPALRRAGVDKDIITALRDTMPPCKGRLALTHCDLYVGNIMVDPLRARVTALIDWESCGFWPEWFQYARITHGCNRDDGEWKFILSKVMQEIIPFADHGRVWYDAVHSFMYIPDSLQAKAWLRLLEKYLRGEVGLSVLEKYHEMDVEKARDKVLMDRAMLNAHGERGIGGYYSTVLGRFKRR
ncbi:hypothetical protein VTI74DRAFT_5457 [Chaetomium olivicolor]